MTSPSVRTDLRRIADVYLRIDTGDGLGAGHVATVTDACAGAEDAGAGGVVLVHLAPAAPDSAVRWPGQVNIALVNRWERALRRLERVPAATVGVAEGRCGAAALDVLLTTDHRLVSTDFRVTVPAGPVVSWPGMALHRLAQQLGVARARRLALATGDLTAEAALRLDIVDEVVDDLGAAVAERVGRLRTADGASAAVRRRLLLDAPTTSFEDALGAHLAACDRVLRAPAAVATGS